MGSDDRGNTGIATLVLLGTVLVIAGGIGAAALGVGPGGAAENAASASDTSAAAASSTATPTATPTSTEPKNVSVLFERWDDKVGIVVAGGADADAITSFTVEGANMTDELDANATHPRGVGTVDAPTTVRVVATFEDGTEQVIAERAFS